MTAGNYGSMRSSEADRENVRQVLQQAHAEGRLSWEDFDARTTALLNSQTYDQLAALTADLPGRILIWFVGGVAAVILGHMALRQIRQTGEDGAGMARAGLILGYLGVALTAIGTIAFISLV